MNDDKHKVSVRVQTKRDTFYCSETDVVSEEVFQRIQNSMREILEGDRGCISVVETGGSEVYIPRDEIAAIVVYKDEAEDE